MALGDKIRELDEQVAAAVRRTIDDLRGEMRRRLDEATVDLQRRLGEVAPELPQSFVSEEHLRQIAEEAAAPSSEALEAAREQGREEARGEVRRQVHADLREALARIDRARSQSDILQCLLDASAGHAVRTVILLARDGRLAGWGARGFEAGADAARGVTLPADEAPWSAVAGGGPPTGVPGARCAPLVSQLDSALPNQGVLVPLVLRERVAAVLYADRPHAADHLDVEALQVLTYAAALALETLTFREREATATLMPAAGAFAPAPPTEAEPAPEPAPEPQEAAEEEPAEIEAAGPVAVEELEEVEVQDLETELEPAVVEEEAAAAPEPEPEPVSEDALAEVEEIELEAETEIEVEELEELEPIGLAPNADEEIAAESDTSFSASYEEAEAAEAPVAAEPEEGGEVEAGAAPPPQEELLTRRYDYLQAVEEADAQAAEAIEDDALEETAFEEAPALEEPPVAEEAASPIPWRTEARDTTAVTPPPIEEEPEVEIELEVEETAEAEVGAEAAAGTAEEGEEGTAADAVPPPPPAAAGPGAVEPPADVEGPGWAFSAAREPVSQHEEAAHEEARRLARLLVSEIQLYNQDEVEEGRRNRDIYERLKDDIDRSRQLYEERVDPGVRETTDYFYQELVRQLASGDAKALGI